MRTSTRSRAVAIAALLAGATVWGLIWYPYRLLQAAGISGALSSTLTYLVALVLGMVFLHRARRHGRGSWMLLPIGLAAGGCNLGYVLATIHGEVMRVLLLFYLAPLWTVLLARLLLGERLNAAGGLVVALSLAGAFVMLWQPALGFPYPTNVAEWIGMASGFLFALSNVFIRKASNLSIGSKSLAVFAGVVLLGLAALPLEPGAVRLPAGFDVWVTILFIGLVLLVINPVVQHGLMLTPANQAVVILLFELVVAAISSWLLAGEQLSPKEWLGGAMIVAASLLSGRLRERTD